jgi:diguanylate cyclase (GGDEF)-like protein
MPGFNGLAALTLLREHTPNLPLIFVSGTIAEEDVVRARRIGAQDYIPKGDLARLVPTVDRQLQESAARFARPHVAPQLVHLAYRDPLTDLPNRVLLHDRLCQAILESQRSHKPLAVMTLELDALDAVVDAHGRHAADRVVLELATRVRARLREVDTVARLGANQFAVMLPGTTAAGADCAAQKVLQAIRRAVVLDGQQLGIDASVGIVSVPEHGASPDELLQKAELALRAAQRLRSGSAVFAPARDRDSRQRLFEIAELREGVELGQFVFDYQPIVHLETGRVVAVEALARWNHPRRGRLLPAEFIELAETTWLIEPLTMLLIERAITEWAIADRPAWTPVAINLSSKCLRDQGLPDLIGELLRLHAAPASSLTLELADDELALESPRTEATLTRLHRMGVRLAIDDFKADAPGSHLRNLPIERLKLGRPLLASSRQDDGSMRGIIELAHDRGLVVVAEGIESEAERARVRALGCDAAQGYYIAAPAGAIEMRRWVARTNADRRGGAAV